MPGGAALSRRGPRRGPGTERETKLHHSPHDTTCPALAVFGHRPRHGLKTRRQSSAPGKLFNTLAAPRKTPVAEVDKVSAAGDAVKALFK